MGKNIEGLEHGSDNFCRRDKYQRHVREYWVDVETVGKLETSHLEEFSQKYTIVDEDGCELPMPEIGGKSPSACLDIDGDSSSDDDDDNDDETPSKTKPTKTKNKKKTPSPQSKRSILRESNKKTRSARKAAKAKEDEVEAALEACARVMYYIGFYPEIFCA